VPWAATRTSCVHKAGSTLSQPSSNNFEIRRAQSTPELTATAALFRAYAASLEIDLTPQGFADELAALPGPYAAPDGAILLAKQGDHVLGCVALKRLEAGAAEIKRLYVRPQARGQGVARALVAAMIDEAKALGYREIKLDTLPQMQAAIALYTAFGFAPIPAYGSHPYPGLVTLGKKLG
jgi:putative acetyltransferase